VHRMLRFIPLMNLEPRDSSLRKSASPWDRVLHLDNVQTGFTLRKRRYKLLAEELRFVRLHISVPTSSVRNDSYKGRRAQPRHGEPSRSNVCGGRSLRLLPTEVRNLGIRSCWQRGGLISPCFPVLRCWVAQPILPTGKNEEGSGIYLISLMKLTSILAQTDCRSTVWCCPWREADQHVKMAPSDVGFSLACLRKPPSGWHLQLGLA
jgi:hypothetical protein